MAKRTIIVSDLTGKEVETLAKVVITTEGTVFSLDADRSEVEESLIANARQSEKRGRKSNR